MTEKWRKAPPGERVKLTALRVANLKKPTRKTMIRDKGSPLRLKLLPSGAATYLTHYRHEGKLRWFTIGPVTGDFKVDLATARRKALWVRRVAEDGRDPAGERRARATVRAPKGTTFADLAGEYVEGHAKLKNRSWRQADRLIRSRVLPVLGSREIGSIRRKDVKAIHTGITAEGHGTMADLVLASVSAVLAWGVEEERLTDNVAHRITRNGVNVRERSLEDDEIKVAWRAMDGPNGDMLKLILLSGQRPGEIRHLLWQHLDGDHWTMPRLPEPESGWPGTKSGARSKSERPHSITFPGAAAAILDDIGRRDTGFVFPGRLPGRPMGPPHTRDMAWDELGIEPFRPHDLRRTAASGMAGRKTNPDLIGRILSHTPRTVTDRVYIKYPFKAEMAAALATWAAHVTSVVNG